MRKQQSGGAWLSPAGSLPRTRGRDAEPRPAPRSLAPARTMAATWNFPPGPAPASAARSPQPGSGCVCRRMMFATARGAVILAGRDEVWVGFNFFDPP